MDKIIVRGARQHNLQNIDVDIPRNRLVVITGLSGSGKSSLAFDTLYAEGQRRYMVSLSAYARQFLQKLDRPDVDLIEALSPAIAIEQKSASRNPRSTVGTITEIYDYLRVLYARLGEPHCPRCHRQIKPLTVQQMVDRILALPEGSRILVLAPLAKGQPSPADSFFGKLRRHGFVRVRIDGDVFTLDEPIKVPAGPGHRLEVVVDRLVVRTEARRRLTDSLELALRTGNGRVRLAIQDGEELELSEQPLCPECNLSLPVLSPQLFSFNSAVGACPECSGLGSSKPAGSNEFAQQALCSSCRGARLRPESLAVTVGGLNIYQACLLDLAELRLWLESLTFPPQQQAVAGRLLQQLSQRLQFLEEVGLSYLNLHRRAPTLSGGEAQRLRLATQIASGLTGVLYILDEPTVGLHQRDNRRLLRTLTSLRDLGNTVLVVEHDPQTIMRADHVIDIGPGAGAQGGHLVFSGTPKALRSCPDSLTGQYLSGRLSIPVPAVRRSPSRGYLTIEGARANNLRQITVSIPVGLFTCVTGVSGAGKSTLVLDTLYRAAAKMLHGSREVPGAYRRIRGLQAFDRVIHIDQSAIGRSRRSNPATYTEVFTAIRNLFAQVPEARARGYRASRFSFNLKGGRCEACRGEGTIKIEMHFLPDLFVTCGTCGGRRFNRDTLEVTYKGKDIAQVLDLTIEEAYRFFGNVPTIRNKLSTLQAVGLGYLKLGQAATTLSGGEAQRIKLARELSKSSSGRTLYLLDEPTTGLHFDDVKRLLQVLQRLVEAGNTVVVIEHHLDVIKSADFVIDLGPEGGVGGGRIVGAGTPEQIARIPCSYTGRFLQPLLAQ